MAKYMSRAKIEELHRKMNKLYFDIQKKQAQYKKLGDKLSMEIKKRAKYGAKD